MSGLPIDPRVMLEVTYCHKRLSDPGFFKLIYGAYSERGIPSYEAESLLLVSIALDFPEGFEAFLPYADVLMQLWYPLEPTGDIEPAPSNWSTKLIFQEQDASPWTLPLIEGVRREEDRYIILAKLEERRFLKDSRLWIRFNDTRIILYKEDLGWMHLEL
ncbi:hypothetical protein TWF281_004991 [Arthrobotrys megalospora]